MLFVQYAQENRGKNTPVPHYPQPSGLKNGLKWPFFTIFVQNAQSERKNFHSFSHNFLNFHSFSFFFILFRCFLNFLVFLFFSFINFLSSLCILHK